MTQTSARSGANMLSNRDRENIDRIEESIAAGPLSRLVEAAPQFERCHNPSPDEFERLFRKTQTPVVIEGAMSDWPALRSWTFEHLASLCGSASVVVDSYHSKRARRITFGEFVEMLTSGTAGPHPVYLQEWLFMADCPFLAADLPELPIAQYDFRSALYGERIGTNHQLWIGQRGATTRIHQDSYVIDVMHAQIVGKKHWVVMSPNAFVGQRADGTLEFETLLSDPDVRVLQCVLEPGEVLYLPALWWHRIQLLSDSIGLGRKCLDQANLQTHMFLRLSELLPLALNHEQVKEAYPELYDVLILRNRAWARLLNIDLTKLRP